MTQHEEKKYSKGDSLDLDARARLTFAATAEDIDERDTGAHQEDISDDELKLYLEAIMNEVKKEETSTKVKDTKKNQVK